MASSVARPDDSIFAGVDLHEHLHLPERFRSMRLQQSVMAQRILDSALDCRASVHAAPTGTGKTLAYVGAAVAGNLRCCVLTATKALQDQIVGDFGRLCLDVRGAGNFRCAKLNASCAVGRRMKCADSYCPYRAQLSRIPQHSGVVATNYAWWISARKAGINTGHFHLLVLDEAHQAVDIVTAFSGARIDADTAVLLSGAANCPHPKPDASSLLMWTESVTPHARRFLETAVRNHDLRRMDKFCEVIDALEAAPELLGRPGTLVNTDNGRILIAPIWPAANAQALLFAGIPSVAVVSATINREICRLLGMELGDYSFYEYDSEFPAEYGPVYLLDVARLSYRTERSEIGKVYDAALDLCKRHERQKGIVHCGSYARASEFCELARRELPHAVFSHTRAEGSSKAVAAHKEHSGPALLISPSVGTGVDFPDEQAEFQILLKTPYPDMKDPIVAARCRKMSHYPAIIAAQALVQISGRGLRHREDRCVTYVLDGNARVLFEQRPGLFPLWFRRRVRCQEDW